MKKTIQPRNESSHRRYAAPEKFEWAAEMRARPTKAEKKLWPMLMPLRQSHGLKFRRQSVIFGWIVDFWCPSRKLVIELDGGYHHTEDQKAKDSFRDETLWRRKGITTIRISNEDVLLRAVPTLGRIIRFAMKLPANRQVINQGVFRGAIPDSRKDVPSIAVDSTATLVKRNPPRPVGRAANREPAGITGVRGALADLRFDTCIRTE